MMEWHSAKDLLSRARLVFAVATELEARPLVEGLQAVHRVEMATKPLWLGETCTEAEPLAYALVVTGYDKVNAAHALTMVLETSLPRLVLQVGVGGAFPASGLRVGDVAVATSDSYGDTGMLVAEGWFSSEAFGMPLAQVRGHRMWNTFESDRELVARAMNLLESGGDRPAGLSAGPFVTLSQVTGRHEDGEALSARWGALIESMEGAAAAHVCALYEVPFLEIRGVSNLVGDRDRAAWQVDRAAAAAARAALQLAFRFDELSGAGTPASPRPGSAEPGRRAGPAGSSCSAGSERGPRTRDLDDDAGGPW